jgi:hypothetical protein
VPTEADATFFCGVCQRIDRLLVRQGFQATHGPNPLTTTWARDPSKDVSKKYPRGFWAAWDGPRWILTGKHRQGQLWFGVEESLLLAALHEALGRGRGSPPPSDLFVALARLGSTVEGLQNWWQWRNRLALDRRSYVVAQYGVSLTDEALKNIITDLVDGLVTFLCEGRPWLSHGTGVGPESDLRGNGIPIPAGAVPAFPFLDLASWLAGELHPPRYRVRGPTDVMQWLADQRPGIRVERDEAMSASLSWLPPVDSSWPQNDRVVKLVHRNEGVYWFGVRVADKKAAEDYPAAIADDGLAFRQKNYAAYRKVPMNLFDQKHEVNDVWFRGFWVRNNEHSRRRILDILKYL